MFALIDLIFKQSGSSGYESCDNRGRGFWTCFSHICCRKWDDNKTDFVIVASGRKMLIKKIFNGLEGIWKFRRKLQHKGIDHPYGEAVGTAVFEKTENNVLFYREEGVLTTNAEEELKFYRENFYEYSENDDKVAKYLAENKQKLTFMYDLQFVKTEKDVLANGTHLCVNDTYKARFRFPKDEFDTFDLLYEVTGPKKDYLSETSYERVPKTVAPRSAV